MKDLIKFINSLTKEDFDRFIYFLKEGYGYPYFSSLYDMDDFKKDIEHFEYLFKMFKR